MITIFYASSNPTKVANLKKWLQDEPVTIVTPKDVGVELSVPETGRSVVDNAILKVKAYYDKVKLPTLAHDTGLYFEELSEEEQPGLFVRRINGKTLTDEEVLEHYTNLSKVHGGSMKAWYYRGVALMTDEGLFTEEIPGASMHILTTPISHEIVKGNPLDVVTIDDLTGKYWIHLTTEEKDDAYGHLGSEIARLIREKLVKE